MRKIGVLLANAAIMVAAWHSPALATGYMVKVLEPGTTPKPISFGNPIGPAGMAVGDAVVSRTCPVAQWVSCRVDGHRDTQPRAMVWPASGGQPSELVCLETTLAYAVSWDKPCEAAAINNKGELVGRSYVGRDATHAQRPVLWRSAFAQPVDLSPRLQNLPAFDSARAVGINDQGWVLGRARVSGGNSEYAFILRERQAVVLSAAGALSVLPVAINNAMAIGEGRYDTGGQAGVIIWSLSGNVTALRAITTPEDHIYASGLSSAGHVTGAYWSPLAGSNTVAYVWFKGRAQPLSTDPGFESRGHSVNAQGHVVGNHCEPSADIRTCRATLWAHGQRIDLNRLAAAPAGYTLVDARAINDQGQITGWMATADGQFKGYVLTPRP